MQNLPIEINFLIGDYLFDCRKNPIWKARMIMNNLLTG